MRFPATFSVVGGIGGSESLLFLEGFSVWLDTEEINGLESSQLLYIHLILFSSFIKEVDAL